MSKEFKEIVKRSPERLATDALGLVGLIVFLFTAISMPGLF